VPPTQAALSPQAAPTQARNQAEAAGYTPTRRQQPAPPAPPSAEVEEESESGLDWIAVGLGFAAFMAVAGLIPLWLLVIEKYFR
jgi:hypothetical protein